VTVVLPPVNGYEGLMMNAGRGATANPRVRCDIVMALDKVRLTNELTYGAGTIATGDLPSFLWAYDPNLKNLPYAPDAARQDLAKLGYTVAKPLVLDFVYEQSQALTRALVVQVQEALHNANVEVHPRAQLSSVIYGGYGANGTLARGHYDMSFGGWVAGIDPDDSSQFTCANIPPGGFNWSYFCDPAMDAAQRIALETYAQAGRKAAYARIAHILADRAQSDYLWWPKQIQAINPDFHGFDPNPVVETWNAWQWSI